MWFKVAFFNEITVDCVNQPESTEYEEDQVEKINENVLYYWCLYLKPQFEWKEFGEGTWGFLWMRTIND